MTQDRSRDYLLSLLKELQRLPNETEWVEFKKNNDKPDTIGEYISALANSAALLGKQSGYLVWGVDDETHAVVGTEFKPSLARNNQQELESWLLQKTAPKIHFRFHEFENEEGLAVAIMEVQAATHTPVKFAGTEFIRIGSYKKKLAEFPEKERELWRVFDRVPFEQQLAAESVSSDDVLRLLDYPAYFELLNLPLPEGRDAILSALEDDDMIQRNDAGLWSIKNLGAVLFARKLKDFRHLERKAIRLIQYKGNNKLETIREIPGNKGYALGYEGLIEYLTALLPSNEEIGKAFRRDVPMYPELALRELVANAIIHQDFSLTGTGPMIELFETRLEITNPGVPLIDTNRFLDTPPRSRNEALASFMRRIGICEERGSGVDKVVAQTEVYQLPAPLYELTDEHIRVTLFAHKEYREMEQDERIRACYLHCCLKYVNKEPMNNTSLRERFNIAKSNSSMVSRVIQQTVDAGLIRLHDPNANRKAYRYVPFWA